MPSQLICFFKFDPTLSANNYASKTPNLKNYHIFGKLRTLAFTWYPPIYVIPFHNEEFADGSTIGGRQGLKNKKGIEDGGEANDNLSNLSFR